MVSDICLWALKPPSFRAACFDTSLFIHRLNLAYNSNIWIDFDIIDKMLSDKQNRSKNENIGI